jgi:hypothetical protein
VLQPIETTPQVGIHHCDSRASTGQIVSASCRKAAVSSGVISHVGSSAARRGTQEASAPNRHPLSMVEDAVLYAAAAPAAMGDDASAWRGIVCVGGRRGRAREGKISARSLLQRGGTLCVCVARVKASEIKWTNAGSKRKAKKKTERKGEREY